jgi:quinoprotein glucose dehydrogenase
MALYRPTLLFIVLLAGTLCAQNDWPTYGHDPASTRHTPLTQVTGKNVANLTRAWTYHMMVAAPAGPAAAQGEAPAAAPVGGRGGAGGRGGSGGRGGGGGRARGSEASPIVVDGIMYLPTPYNRVVALQPETGKELWNYEIPAASASTRGVEYWAGDGQSPASIFFGTTDGRLVGLNAKTGKLIPGFGTEGSVNMKAGIDNGFSTGNFSLSSPPKIYKNLIITGARVQESPSLGFSGDTRAWDAHTGKLVWQFHSVPRPGEAGSDTWKGDDWVNRSGTNVWGLISVDTQLGLVYLPYGSASYDFYGGDREGANLFGNTLVALDAATGKLKWYFQTVHHDTWDYDLEAAPILFEMTRNNAKVPALAVTSKTGLVFILDRRTGKPLYDVEERPVPSSEVPGEHAWPTEPFPVKPAPLSRMSFKADEIAKVTPEHEKFCRELLESDGGMAFGGPFNRYGMKTTINFPGTLGATNWHGGSYDPTLGYLFYNTLDLADTGKMVKNASGTYVRNGFARFWNSENYWPCQAPPWGEMVAINVNTGDYAWRVPLGVVEELEAKGVHNTGTMNMGGSLSTAGGLVFIGATNDRRFRAFDSKTGKILWEVQLEAGAYASPVAYQGKDGKEYIVIVAAGGGYYDRQTGDSVIAFALP